MNKVLLTLTASLVAASINVSTSANELHTSSWNFPTPDQMVVKQNKLSFYCRANPSKCPAGLSAGKSGASGSGEGGLFDPKTSATANHISVVLAGDNSSVVLNTDQDASGTEISAESEVEGVTIDNEEIQNIANN